MATTMATLLHTQSESRILLCVVVATDSKVPIDGNFNEWAPDVHHVCPVQADAV